MFGCFQWFCCLNPQILFHESLFWLKFPKSSPLDPNSYFWSSIFKWNHHIFLLVASLFLTLKKAFPGDPEHPFFSPRASTFSSVSVRGGPGAAARGSEATRRDSGDSGDSESPTLVQRCGHWKICFFHVFSSKKSIEIPLKNPRIIWHNLTNNPTIIIWLLISSQRVLLFRCWPWQCALSQLKHRTLRRQKMFLQHGWCRTSTFCFLLYRPFIFKLPPPACRRTPCNAINSLIYH